MAEQSNLNININSFTKGLQKDLNDTYVDNQSWTHGRNLVTNSHDGELGVIGNEPSNILCVDLPYTFIGSIPIGDDEWAVFTTDDLNSEIGIFNEAKCTYTKVVNDSCLKFNRKNLIIGAYKKRFDCGREIYWDDTNNPSRKLNLDNIPFKKKRVKQGDCYIETDTKDLDCEQLRLAAILDVPCLTLRRGKSSGTLANGSYQVVIAYTVNDIRVTDFIAQSEVQPIFSHQNISGSLELDVTGLDQDYGEFELVIITSVNQQTVAKRLGIYSTKSTTIYIDTIDPSLPTVPLNLIPLRTYAIDKSDAMYTVNDYLLRVGIYTKPDFNYQIQANNIVTKWVSVKYPADYYHKGGNKASYMRDEQGVFFIRWIYNTGDKSASYFISGREPIVSDNQVVSNADALESQQGLVSKRWQVYNTSTVTNLSPGVTLPDGGVVISEGLTGYYESTEKYPDNQPEIWGDLCGKNIRLHKFPDNTVDITCNHFNSGGESINILGVKFENITPPVDNAGNVIESIIGYEILRGSREGQRSIIAKGLISNMREYDIENNDVKGLYANYPYNDLRPDYYLTSNKELSRKGPSGGADSSIEPLTNYRKDIFSFHSPETTFSKPFLSGNELKVYQEVHGTTTGKFEVPYKHPKHKLATGFSDTISKVIGVLATLNSLLGALTGADGVLQLEGTEDIPLTQNLLAQHRAEMFAGTFFGLSNGFVNSVGVPGAGGAAAIKRQAANTAITIGNAAMVIALSTVTASATSEKLFNVIMGLIPTRQYALQYNSHGFYDKVISTNVSSNHRRSITQSNYVGSNVQSFTGEFRINNLYRPNYVVLKLNQEISNPSVEDKSRNRIKGDQFNGEINDTFTSTISSHYAALKTNLPAQYGQIGSVKQLPISTCIQKITPVKNQKFKSDILFGGDTYINRFTEKNTYFFFNDWLLGQPDEYEHDYRNYINGPYPRYWVNFEKGNYSLFSSNSTGQRHLNDRESSTFYVKKGYFYLFCNGIRDFFVESEINLALRDWEDTDSKRHYDPYEYTDLSSLLRSDIVKSNNFYKYDYSLSNSRIFNSYITWGDVLPRDYDPLVAETCFAYYPKRIHYSLPQQTELKKDNWASFLVNNYKDMPSDVTSIKSIGKSGALIMMKSQSPLQFAGVDELQTTSGAKITIGDGGLFARPLQNLVNADEAYEYGSSQSKFGTIATPQGVFYISQNQGKIFNYAGGLDEISRNGNKFWFSQYLPSYLLKDFPNFELTDNPVIGIGCQAIYDNTNEIIYFSKKDYKVRDEFKSQLVYVNSNQFLYNGLQVTLGDETYFEDASWTMSYDPKSKQWLSHHDWHPTFMIPGRNHFMTVNTNSVWTHNNICDSYCNFYGIDYPFEIEYISSTGQTVNTVKSVEYILECYKYSNGCQDRFHILDYNFDRAIVYNSEQNSGMLKLNLSPKGNPIAGLKYPIIGLNFTDILYSKEENKYRFNQFFDLTKDRGEFTGNDKSMFISQSNGYIYQLNNKYLDYSKGSTQHKKFRMYTNKVFLRKVVSGEVKMNLKLINTKLSQSLR